MSEYPEPRYKAIVEKSPDLIFITNDSGVLYINPSGVEYLGYQKEEEILGRPALDFIHPDSHEITTKYAQQRRAGANPPSQYRAKLLGKKGKALEAELHASRIIWNNAPASVTIARDISKQIQLEKELQEINERLTGFMESATDGFALLDEKLRLIEANKVWLNQAGLTREQAIGRHCTDILPNLEKTGRLDIYKKVLETGEPTEFNEVIPASGGDQYFDIKTFKTGSLLGIVTRDITDQVTYDKKLQELHQLSDKLSRAQSVQEIAEIVVEAVVDTLDCKRVSFQTIKEDKLVIQAAKPSISIHQIPLDKPSIVVRAFKTGQPQHIPDTTKDPDYLEGIAEDESPSLSEYAHPIKLREEPIAVINIEEPERNAFTEQTLELVSILGDHVSAALQAQSYRDRLVALHSSSTHLTHAESSEEVYAIAMDILVEELGYTWAGIMYLEDHELRYVYTSDGEHTDKTLPRDGAGITVKAANSKTTQLVKDTRLDPDFVTLDSGPPTMLSELAVPVFIEDNVKYVLNVESSRVDDFDENDVRLVELLAQHVASTIQNIKALEARKRYEALLETLHQYASQVARMDSIQEIADTSIDFIVDVMGFNRAGIGLVEGEYLHPISLADPELKARSISLKEPSIIARAVNTGESQLIEDTRKDKDYLLYNEAGPDYSYSELAVPIKDGGTVIGVINIESTEIKAYDQRDQILMELFAEHISSALRNIKASEDQQIYEQRLESLSSAMASMNSAQSIEEIAEISLILVEEIIEAPYSGFLRVIGDELALFKNISDLAIDYRLSLDGKGITVRAVNEKRPILVNDTKQDPDYVKGTVETRSELAVPIFVEGEVEGVLNMESSETDFFNKSHISLAEVLVSHIASNLERLKRRDALLEAERKAVMEHERAEQAKKMEQIKSQFMRTATHELRTPLTSMKGYLELARTEKDPDKTKKYLEIAARNTDRLEALTTDLLDQQRLEDGQLEIVHTPLNLNELVNRSIEEVRHKLESKHQKIKIETPPEETMVQGDPLRLSQVLVNLLDNASKYSPEGSLIQVTVKKTGEEGKVSVTDTGYGLSPEDMDKLFKPFPDIDRPIVSGQSVGLGLSICKGIVELHGGEIWAESRGLGEGSTFTFKLPLWKE